jgi:hypothetical protein
MKGILKEKSEIEKLQQEFQILTEQKQKELKKVKNKEEELILEEC